MKFGLVDGVHQNCTLWRCCVNNSHSYVTTLTLIQRCQQATNQTIRGTKHQNNEVYTHISCRIPEQTALLELFNLCLTSQFHPMPKNCYYFIAYYHQLVCMQHSKRSTSDATLTATRSLCFHLACTHYTTCTRMCSTMNRFFIILLFIYRTTHVSQMSITAF